MKYTYHVEVESSGEWIALGWFESRGYVLGYVNAMATVPGPRLAYRAVRGDGRVIVTTRAKTSVSLGMVAGFPSADQYESAGREALEHARITRAHEAIRMTPEEPTP